MSKFHDLNEDLDDSGDEGEGDPTADISRCCDQSGIDRKDFLFGRTLGEGSYARVVHAKRKADNTRSYAVKIMEKAFIRKEKKVTLPSCNRSFELHM
jgi:serine/threonine protein kinase